MSDSSEKLKLVQTKLDSVKTIMVDTIDNVLERGDKLEHLVDKTENLDSIAFQFKNNAKKLKYEMICKKIKYILCILILILFIIWFISSLIFGFNYKQCK